MDFLRRLDDRVFRAINSLSRHTDWLHSPMVDYAKFGVILFFGLLVIGLVMARRLDNRTLAAAGWAPIAVLLALAANQPLSGAVHEARPYDTHPHVLVLVTRSTDWSFPSDHAVMAGAVAVGLLFVSRRLGFIALGAALLMAFARVYVAAHYPWDVLAGLVFGGAVALLSWLLLRTPLTELTGWLRRQRVLAEVFAPADRREDLDRMLQRLGGVR